MQSSLTNIYSKPFFILFFSFVFSQLNAQQTTFNFGELSSSKYKEKITQLEKYTVPAKYTEKSAQAWYKEILTDRNKDLLESFKYDQLVYDTLLLNKCNNILARIINSNKNYKFDSITLYIDRSIIPNAYNTGEGTIGINLGLFMWFDNDDELALVIAHELAHQLLKHFDSKVEKTITLVTSEEFQEKLKNIKKANYGKLAQFRELMKDFDLKKSKHSRYKEIEADSLAVVMIRNAKYNVNTAANILLKLDKVDDLFISNKLYTLKDYVEKSGIDISYFAVKPKYNGLSSINVEMNINEDLDSLKTHPDCIKRYEIAVGKNVVPVINCCTELNSMYSTYKENTMIEIVRYLYENNKISKCMHMCLFALKNNYNPNVYNGFLSLCFSKLYDDDKHLARFKGANADAERESNLKETQDFLFAASNKDLETLAAYFLNKKTDANSEDYAFADLMYNTQVKMKDAESANASFLNKFPHSKYQYLIQKK